MKPGVLSRLLVTLAVASVSPMLVGAPATPSWQWAGWGGGGFYYSAVFHPTRDGVIYMGGDVTGAYRSDDHGRSWRLINQGLVDYGVFSLAVDRTAPDTVYAATAGGLCKSTDAGDHWRLLPNTGRKGLRITGEKGRSIRCIAVDPTNGKIVYAASPGGKVYKSTDGGKTWKVAYEKAGEQARPDALRVQFGKVNDGWHGGFWLPLVFPRGVASTDCAGIGFTFRSDGTLPRDCFLTLKASDGTAYRSHNLRAVFGQTKWGDVVLGAKDFTLDPDYAKKHPEKAKAYTGTPDWSTVNRLDFVCVGPPMKEASVGKFTRFFFAVTRTADGAAHPATAPHPQVVKTFAKGQSVRSYGNIRVGPVVGGPVYSVAVAEKQPAVVLAATHDVGLVLSRDAGRTWRELATPKKASSVVVAPSDPTVMYATFFKKGIRKSTDLGRTWQDVSRGLPEDCALFEVAVSPVNPDEVHVIGSVGWNGAFFSSGDGGQTWKEFSQLT
ncbi:MAG: hypothetical protein HN380_09095, partial [Victivallales bacterium]|nr:hypothetical protein [Victivallales bacterium]